MEYQVITDVNFKNQVVLVRTDYNVPLEDGKITDDLRIRASLPTLEALRKGGAKKIIIISHLGRPEGKDKKLSMKVVAERLAKMLPDVSFVDDVSGPDVEVSVKKLKDGGILVLENLRFYDGEEKNSEEFMREIVDSVGAEIYVQDGFAVAHRKHASVAAVQKILPVYMGLLVDKELKNLQSVIDNPVRPLLFIIGGAKVEDKAPLIDRFTKIADEIFVGGKIAADGYKSHSQKIYVAEDFDEDAEGAKLDVGPISTVKLVDMIEKAGTIVWNGLLGKAEDPAYATSSSIVAEALGKSKAKTIICGGDTTGFVENYAKEHKDLEYSLISTGGGAALEFLAGKTLFTS